MSAFGSLSADWTHLLDDGGADNAGVEEPESLPGAWSQDLDVSIFAASSMTLPGQGSKGPNCGVWKPKTFCDSCADVQMGPTTCGRRSCPDCGRTIWTGERTEGLVRRLAAARHAADEGLDKRAVHCVASAPEGSVRSLQHVYDGFRDAYELAREKGVRGGVAVFHGFRVQDHAVERYRAEDPDCGIWRWIFQQDESWRSLTFWSPHWHIVGLARDVAADDPDSQDGWVFRRIRSLEPQHGLRDRDAYDDLAGLTRYLMSHASFEADSSRDCVRWFGSLATTNFSPDELSDGALSVIDRMVEEVVGSSPEDGEAPADDDECCESCGGSSLSPIWDAGAALQDQGWCDRLDRDHERRLNAAWRWSIGEAQPPPGLKSPSTEAEAEETLEALL